jgi:hypothetical protein
MDGRVHLREQVIHDLAIDKCALALVQVGLEELVVGAVNNMEQLRNIDIQQVRGQANNRAVFIMKPSGMCGIIALVGSPHAPEVCPSYPNLQLTAHIKGHIPGQTHQPEKGLGIVSGAM